MAEKKSSLIPGVLLVLFGVILLLNKLNWVELYWEDVYPIIFIAIGIVSFVSVFIRNHRNASFWGTFFLILGVFFVLRNYDIITYYYWDEIWPIVPLAIGIAFFVLFFFKPQDWGVLIPGSILLFIGLISLAQTLDLYWQSRELIEDFWPLIFIIIGGGLVASSLLGRKKQPEESNSKK